MTTELHLTYLCVPITETVGLDWKRFENMLGTLQVRGFGWGGAGWPGWLAAQVPVLMGKQAEHAMPVSLRQGTGERRPALPSPCLD